MQAGTPPLIVEARRDNEVGTWPAPVRAIGGLELLEAARLRVFYGRRKLRGRERAVWYLEAEARANMCMLRRLRLVLTRVHSTLAALRSIADACEQGRLAPVDPEPRERLARALPPFLELLYKERHEGMDLPPFIQAALSMAETMSPALFTSLRGVLGSPGRGLASQVARAAEHWPALQPEDEPDPDWDFFIAHAGPDLAAAKAVKDALGPSVKTFLDQDALLPGDQWPLALPRAQRRSRITVVLVGPGDDKAYYLQSEVVAAIRMLRMDDSRHRVVPVYLQGATGRSRVHDYGLDVLHGIEAAEPPDWPAVAARLRDTLGGPAV